LEVVPITRSLGKSPILNGKGMAIEYARKMMPFPWEAQLDRTLDQNELKPFHLDALARIIATFHKTAQRAETETAYGDLEQLSQPVYENFSQIRDNVSDKTLIQTLVVLQTRGHDDIHRLKSVFDQCKADGFIREYHGDLHLRNMAWVRDKPSIFDCIEFNPNLRWIDVISEIAFLLVDLEKRKQSELAYRFLNAFLERSGNYHGLLLPTFYRVYRTLVRTKVEAIRSGQSNLPPKEQATDYQSFHDYLELAVKYNQGRPLHLIINHGLSGSGKTTLTHRLIEQFGETRVRSDVERKRLFGLKAEDNGRARIEKDTYNEDASQRTYRKLVELADHALEGGYPVIIDAAFLKAEQRASFLPPCVNHTHPLYDP
jgi:aminoglycoside phosphotransferase family enzyme